MYSPAALKFSIQQDPSFSELITIVLYAANVYVGINVGKLDQPYEVLCKKDQLLYLDTKDDSYSLILSNPNMPVFELAVFYSGLSRNLGSGYNTRVDEAKSRFYNLKALAGLEYGLYKDSRFRDVPVAVYEQWKGLLPPVFAKRALPYYSEMDRIVKGIVAWRRGDFEAFGQLVFESGYSSINYRETGCPELIAI